MAEAQTYATHRRYIPEFHFFVLPVLIANAVATLIGFMRHPRFITGWIAIVAIALALGIWTARRMALRAQNRIIRLEERMRLDRLLPFDLRERVGELHTNQLVAIRFAPDEEVPDLVRRTLDGDLKTPADIKRAIRRGAPTICVCERHRSLCPRLSCTPRVHTGEQHRWHDWFIAHPYAWHLFATGRMAPIGGVAHHISEWSCATPASA
jgi:hypothetical protein